MSVRTFTPHRAAAAAAAAPRTHPACRECSEGCTPVEATPTAASVLPGLASLSLDRLSRRAAPTMVAPYERTNRMPPKQVSEVMRRIVAKIADWKNNPRGSNHWEYKPVPNSNAVYQLSWYRFDNEAGQLPAELGGDTPSFDGDDWDGPEYQPYNVNNPNFVQVAGDDPEEVSRKNAVSRIISAFWTQGFLGETVTINGERIEMRITGNKLNELQDAQNRTDDAGVAAPKYTTSALNVFQAIFQRDQARTQELQQEQAARKKQRTDRAEFSRQAAQEQLAREEREGYMWATQQRPEEEAARQQRRDAEAREREEAAKESRARGVAKRKERNEYMKARREHMAELQRLREDRDWLEGEDPEEPASPERPREFEPRAGSPSHPDYVPSDDDWL